ncbi:PucR family transcriptional regulator [Rhodococcus sp. 1R11]|uniref:PucR family transcriptional regulator n=1 Tax=Rhodococcus sp. 1R11 TaxID=2559614 RepID=UPI00107241AA|nr:helix-turn-helix domain-containing protein [Rhodococcus sp. 1R11]TFI44845.1 PucR family transcriptional regulator [Rhodococcus sp. 1R11]
MTLPRATSTLLRALEVDEHVVGPTVRRVREEIAAYAAVSDAAIAASAERNLRRAVRTLRNGTVPEMADIWEADTSIKERLRAGVPIEDVMAGFRVSISCIQDRLMELAAELQIEGSEVVRLTRVLWKLGDVFSAQAASSYRQYGVASDLAEQRLRDEALLSLLDGPMAAEALDRGMAVLGLDPEESYVPFITRRTDAAGSTTLQRVIAERYRGEVCIVVPTGQQLFGLLPRVPDAIDDVVLAIGPATTPAHLHHAFAVARRVLDATAPTEVGVASLDKLGWRLGVPIDSELAAFLRRRYLDPLHSTRGAAAPVIAAVQAFLEHNRSIPRAADAMHVHVNTLRYRLARFEELTGRSLSDTDTVIELSWALRSVDIATS